MYMSSKKDKDREIREIIDTTLDETKSSVNKTTNEAKKEVPQYTKAVNEYQQETIQATKDIADSFLESQKQVMNSAQSLWAPYIENVQNSYWSYWTPKSAAENYTRAVSNITDSTIAATRLANNFMFASMEAWRTTIRHTRDNAIEFSRLNANYARTFRNLALDNLREYQVR
jgi:vacuolar-type H+-ATPase subunit H